MTAVTGEPVLEKLAAGPPLTCSARYLNELCANPAVCRITYWCTKCEVQKHSFLCERCMKAIRYGDKLSCLACGTVPAKWREI